MTELLRAAEAVLSAYMAEDDDQLAQAIYRLGLAVAQVETVTSSALCSPTYDRQPFDDDEEIGYEGVR